MADLFIDPVFSPQDAIGRSVPGAQLFTYEPGSTDIFKVTYQDAEETITNSNPIIADGDGRFPPIYLDGLYRMVLQDSDNVELWDADNVGGSGSGSGNTTIQSLTTTLEADNLTVTTPSTLSLIEANLLPERVGVDFVAGVSMDPISRDLWVIWVQIAGTSSNYIWRYILTETGYKRTGEFLDPEGDTGLNLNPQDLCFSQNGAELWVVTTGVNRLFKYDRTQFDGWVYNSGSLVTAGANPTNPSGIDIDSTGAMWFAGGSGSTALFRWIRVGDVFSYSGVLYNVPNSTSVFCPAFIDSNTDNDMWLAYNNSGVGNTIERFNENGTQSWTATAERMAEAQTGSLGLTVDTEESDVVYAAIAQNVDQHVYCNYDISDNATELQEICGFGFELTLPNAETCECRVRRSGGTEGVFAAALTTGLNGGTITVAPTDQSELKYSSLLDAIVLRRAPGITTEG